MASQHRTRLGCKYLALIASALGLAAFQTKAAGSLWTWVLLPEPPVSQQHQEHQEHQEKQLDKCMTLRHHTEGRWNHFFFGSSNTNRSPSSSSSLLNSSSIRSMYLPEEIDWIAGEELPPELALCRSEGYAGFMYGGTLGNRCGKCSVKGFEPSHSVWLYGTAGGHTSPPKNRRDQGRQKSGYYSPGLQLIQRLATANQTLCFAGDSIDHQLYFALRNSIVRAQLHQKADPLPDVPGVLRNLNIALETREIPVEFTDETTGRPPRQGFMVMSTILETVVSLKRNDNISHKATFRFFLTYGWSPWNTPFMEDCNIIVMNLGLHYRPRDNMTSFHLGHNKLTDDIRAAITYLVDFTTSKKRRLAVWRSALPQHFETVDGHYEKRIKDANSSCVPLPKNAKDRVIQNYNLVYEEVFNSFCNDGTKQKQPQKNFCSNLLKQHSCTVNRTSMDYQTVYKFLVDSSTPVEISALHKNNEPSIITGNILRWNIADIFDVPWWHVNDKDCTHFCYIPPLYEAAFERLNLLLPSLD